MKTMRAAVVQAHGGPDTLVVGEAPHPDVGPGEILVRVGACAVNHLDIFVRRGIPGHELPVPYVPGADVAGWVESAADAEGAALVGLPVLLDPFVDGGALGESRGGGMAEYVVVPAANAIPLAKPGDLARYAALPVAYGTAYKMLFRRARLDPGETVVVVSAGGGVGVACVQLAAARANRVIACTGSADKAERLRAIGADEVVAIADGSFSAAVRGLTGGRGGDVLVDFTGSATWPETVRSARRDARIVTCGATSGPEVRMDQRYVFWRELSILGSNGWVREDLVLLADLVASGELDPVLHRIVSLDDAPEAFAELEERRAFGKVVVRVAD
jgi:NADPH:quinone reductase-like Zn-dependent oxidoreductase